jgi:hypothetical protein
MLTELGTAAADASTIQLIAGHEDIRTSQKYPHPTPDHVLMAFERMHAMRQVAQVRTKGQMTVAGGNTGTGQRLPTIFTTVTRQELANIGNILITNSAKVAELADAPDLGSGG